MKGLLVIIKPWLSSTTFLEISILNIRFTNEQSSVEQFKFICGISHLPVHFCFLFLFTLLACGPNTSMENTGFPKLKPWSNGVMHSTEVIFKLRCSNSWRNVNTFLQLFRQKGCVRKSVYVLTPSTIFPKTDLHSHFNSMHIPLFRKLYPPPTLINLCCTSPSWKNS